MHPILFVLEGAPIYTYGTLMAVAMGVAGILLAYLAKREGIPAGRLLAAYGVAIFAGIFGSRLLYLIVSADDLGSLVAALDMKRGGLVAYGGFLGAVAGAYVVLRRGPIRPLAALDLAVPCFAAWIAILRIGCYAFGCDFGVPLPAGAPAWLKALGTFPRWPEGTLVRGVGSPAWLQHVQEHRIPLDAATSLPVHPTQLYESLLGVLLFWAWFAARPYQRFRGQLFLSFVTLYGACRFVIEVLRDGERGEIGPTFAEHRIIPAGLLIFGLAYAVRMAPAVENVTVRRITQAAALVPALVALAALSPRSFGDAVTVELTVSQVIALLTGVAASLAFAVLHRRAVADPEAAMAVGEVARDTKPKKKRRRKTPA